jgi:hypothetical protein
MLPVKQAARLTVASMPSPHGRTRLEVHRTGSVESIVRVLVPAPKTAKRAPPMKLGGPGGGGSSLWTRVKREFRSLICTNHKRYATLRKQFASTTSQKALISLFSAAIGKALGVAAIAAAPFVVLCLATILHIGKEAYCRTDGT